MPARPQTSRKRAARGRRRSSELPPPIPLTKLQ
jgi:hypothetical protein